MRKSGVWIFVAVCSGVLGFFLGQETRNPGVDRARAPSAERESAPDRSSESSRLDVDRAHAATHANPVPSQTLRGGGAFEVLVGRPPTDEEQRRIRESAEADRTRLRQALSVAESSAAHRIAVETKQEMDRIEDLQRGGTMAMLRALRGKPTRLHGLVSDPKTFCAHFERLLDGPRLDGTKLAGDQEVPDGAVIEFGPGVHTLDTRQLFSRRRAPRDLLIVGAGMDRTLVRIQEISTSDVLASLHIRDLTLDCNNDYMTDLRSQNPATIRLERCRVVGFDMAAGGSVMFAARSGALFASDCRFEAGYGRAKAGSGNLFRVRSGCLVRLERCTILGPFRSLYDADEGATYRFVDCDIAGTSRQLARYRSDDKAGVVFENCRLEEIPADASRIHRSLSDLHPDWPPHPSRKNR
ncbi:MAG: hypothetical protein AAGD14_11995 [Planctomycetota bacterium]